MESVMVVEKIPEGEKSSEVIDVLHEKLIPSVFLSDLFDYDFFQCYLTSDLDIPICCNDCAYEGTVYCNYVKQFNQENLCVEEEEVSTAVAGVGKSSERYSETASSGESRAKPCVKPLKKDI